MQWSLLVSAVATLFGNSWAKAVTADSPLDNHLAVDPQPLNHRGKMFGFCSDSLSLKSCFKMRSLIILDDLASNGTPIHLFGNSLVLVKSDGFQTGSRMLPITLEELNSSLPKDDPSREETLDRLVSLSFSKFIKSRSIQVRLPDFSYWNWNSIEEGRKKKGGGGAGGWAVMSACMMGALGLGAIAMMAGKAMMVSMMALMLAALASMKKGGGGGHDHAATYEVINVPTGHGHHARALGRARSLVEGLELPAGRSDELVYTAHQELQSGGIDTYMTNEH